VRGGKGGKDRLTYLAEGAGEALADWLKIRGEEAGPLFYPLRRGGHIEKRRMKEQSIFDMLVRRGGQARIASFSPHDLRRTFISDLLDAGADIATVQKLVGHANVQTTAGYDRRGEVAKRKAASLLHIAYFRASEGKK
jgi:integrase